MMNEITIGTLESVSKLSKDVAAASSTLELQEIRFLVDLYYLLQENRKATGNQIHAMSGSNEPHIVIDHYFKQFTTLESQIKRVLDRWTNDDPLATWAKSQIGIGPVISAGLRAHIDITKCTSAGHIWSFAGLVPGQEWAKGQKRPWNAGLKTLCWKIGESFVKTCNHDESFYGPIYAGRKALEIERNESGQFADQAAAKLAKYNIGKTTDAYKAYSTGKLPPAHIQSRAKRYAVKLFLAHYFEVGYRLEYHTEPPLPYPIAHMGHVDVIKPPKM